MRRAAISRRPAWPGTLSPTALLQDSDRHEVANRTQAQPLVLRVGARGTRQGNFRQRPYRPNPAGIGGSCSRSRRSTAQAPGWQPVAKVPAAFERRCIPPDCVAPRSNMPNILPRRALSGAGGLSPRTGGLSPRTGGLSPRTGGLSPRTGGLSPRAGGLSPRTGGLSPRAGGLSPRALFSPLAPLPLSVQRGVSPRAARVRRAGRRARSTARHPCPRGAGPVPATGRRAQRSRR